MLTKGRIDRTGVIKFHDASLAVWEDGLYPSVTWDGRTAWERQFKRDVFARIVQQLNRLGWTVGPQHHIRTGNNARFCQKGDLKGDLSICGRHIEFNMFQSVNCPTRPDHEGRYERDKEQCMPYLVRLEMERTRRRIRDYLCNVFTGYAFEPPKIKCGPDGLTAYEHIQQRYAESWHFKGKDWGTYKNQPGMIHNVKSADGHTIEHFQQVWFLDHKGRWIKGTALYNINNMWWVICGTYRYTNEASFKLYVNAPANPRAKHNTQQRRRRLEEELAKAIKAMNFERAAVLRDILFPNNPDLFVVWHRGHKAYHCSNFQGYTGDIVKAGKFTAEEVKGWDFGENEIQSFSGQKVAA